MVKNKVKKLHIVNVCDCDKQNLEVVYGLELRREPSTVLSKGRTPYFCISEKDTHFHLPKIPFFPFVLSFEKII